MEQNSTNTQKIRALPWALAGDGANIVFVNLTFAGPVFLLFLDSLNLDKPQIGVVLSIIPFCGLVSLFLMPLIAWVGYKRTYLIAWGMRKFVLALLIATPWVLRQWGPHAAFIFVAGVILAFSLCRSIGLTAFSPWVLEFVPNNVRGKFTALQNIVFVALGAATLAAAGPVLGDDPPLDRFTILFMVGIGFGLLSVMFYVPVPGGRSIRTDDQQGRGFRSMGKALCNRQFLLFLLVGALVTLAWAPLSMGGFLPLFLKEQVGFEPDEVLYFNAVHMGSGVVSCFVWGWAADRYGSKPVLYLTILVLWFYPMGLWTLPRQSGLSFYAALALAMTMGMAVPGWSIAYTRLLFVKLIPRDQRSGYSAVHLAWFGLISGLAPLIAGQVLQRTAALRGEVGFLVIDPYTPLIASALVLMGLAMFVLSRVTSDSNVPVARFAGMFIQGNALAAMQALIAYQLGGVEGKRVSTIERLGQAKSPLSVEELIEGLHDPGFNVRFEAIVSIARTRPDPRLTKALIDVLQAAEPDMRITAAWALGRVGDRRAVEPLREAINSDYPLLCARAARALGTLSDGASSPLLLERFNREPDTGLKLAYASALGALHEPQALVPLLDMLADLDDVDQRMELALAIASIAGQDNWFVLLARRVGKDAGDALGGVLLSMRRCLLRGVGEEGGGIAAVRDLIDHSVLAFGDGDVTGGVEHLTAVIESVPRDRLAPVAQIVLRDAGQRTVRFGADRLEYPMLCLHALHTGFGASAQPLAS